MVDHEVFGLFVHNDIIITVYDSINTIHVAWIILKLGPRIDQYYFNTINS